MVSRRENDCLREVFSNQPQQQVLAVPRLEEGSADIEEINFDPLKAGLIEEDLGQALRPVTLRGGCERARCAWRDRLE